METSVKPVLGIIFHWNIGLFVFNFGFSLVFGLFNNLLLDKSDWSSFELDLVNFGVEIFNELGHHSKIVVHLNFMVVIINFAIWHMIKTIELIFLNSGFNGITIIVVWDDLEITFLKRDGEGAGGEEREFHF